MLETDEQGNRTSILPSKERPKPPSSRKRAASKRVKEFEQEMDEEETKDLKNAEKNKKLPVKKAAASKEIVKKAPIIKTGPRQNFVKMNLKNYKPRLRGAAYTNKIMAKKRNFLKSNERFKKRLQIQQAKERDQVNAFGGLGKVGLDHEGGVVKKEGD